METWQAVDALAREVRAIRRAVSTLEDELSPEERKPWWVRTVHATGEFPEERLEGTGPWNARSQRIARVVF
jgi:hypothetical protein